MSVPTPDSSPTLRARRGYNWMLVVALLLVAAWLGRLLIAGPGIGMTLWGTSAGLVVVGILLFSWYTGRRRRSTGV